MKYLIGLDIGTSAVKGVLMTEEGRLCNTVTSKFTYHTEENARLMQPQHFVEVCFSVIKELAAGTEEGAEISAICSCCASGNLILLDKENAPITPIIGWQTAISIEDCAEFYSEEEKRELYKKVGWPVGTHMPISYLPAIRKYKKALLEKTQTITMSAEYLNFCLTGKWGISHSMGTPFFLIDQEKGVYNEALIKKLDIEDKFLPPIYPKGTVLGSILPPLAEKLGLSTDTKVVLGTFDHPSGALGAGVFEEGEMLLSCGTSWVEFFPVNSREFAISTNGLVDRFMLDGTPYCLMKSISSISEKINSARVRYLGEISHKVYDDLVSGAKLGCNGLVLDFTEEDDARVIGFDKCDIARAIVEAAATLLKNNLSELKKCGLRADKITLIGGISNSAICTAVISEVLESPVSVVNGESAGAVGSCLLAGVGAGLFANEKAAFDKHVSFAVKRT